MAWADLASRFFADIARRRHEEDTAQARQQQANRFAIAWNRGVLAVPSSLVCSMPCPDGTTAPAWPGCAASISDDAQMLLTFTVTPDAAVTADDVEQQVDAIRLAAREFFGTRLRVTGVETVPGRCSMQLTPVNPACDGQKILAGFDDRGAPVWVPLLGQVTAIAGDDGAASWISACVSGAIPTTAADPHAAVSDARRVGLAAKTSGQPPAPLLVALDEAQPGADQLRAEQLGFARRGLVEWDTASQVDSASWAVRPTQVITRIGDRYVVERDGRKTSFTPAWLY